MNTSFTFGTWYPIEDAPYDTPILVVAGQAWPDAGILRHDDDDDFIFENADREHLDRETYPITHWMPLPPKPEQPQTKD